MREMLKLYKLYNEAYYTGAPIESDSVFDKLKKDIYSHKDFALFKDEISKIDIVGAAVPDTSSLPYKHIIRMFSLDNVFSIEELGVWVDKTAKDAKYLVELKYDGISIDLDYRDGLFYKAITRGDGKIGLDVSDTLRGLVPKRISESGDYNIHAEVIITFKEFEKANVLRLKAKVTPYISPRNAAAGEVMHNTGYAKLTVLPFVMFKDGVRVPHKDFIALRKHPTLKTKTPYHIANGKEEVLNYLEEVYYNKYNTIPVDGLVIKLLDNDLIDKLGYTSKFPRSSIALKFEAQDATTKLVDVIWQVGSTGNVTPVGLIEPVTLDNAVISRVTLNNLNFVLTLGLGYNDKVNIIRSGGVIPKLTGVLKKGNPVIPVVIPSKCPSCSKPTSVNGPILKCSNTDCKGLTIGKLNRFVSRDYANVKGVSRELITKLYSKGVDTLPKLVSIDREILLTIDGLGDKSIDKILSAFKKLRGLPLDRFMSSLGIDGLGKTTSRLIAERIDSIDDLCSLDLVSINGIGYLTGSSILINYIARRKEINELEKILNPKPLSITEDKPSVCFTGTFKMSRGDLKALYEEKGYMTTDRVNKDLNLLVCGKDASSKLEKAKKLDINITYLF